jgi:hypothetical protein
METLRIARATSSETSVVVLIVTLPVATWRFLDVQSSSAMERASCVGSG